MKSGRLSYATPYLGIFSVNHSRRRTVARRILIIIQIRSDNKQSARIKTHRQIHHHRLILVRTHNIPTQSQPVTNMSLHNIKLNRQI